MVGPGSKSAIPGTGGKSAALGASSKSAPTGSGSTTPMLEIRDLHARVGDNEILRGVDLTLYPGEVHTIMGPNGSGKSTLAHVLAGRDGYVVTQGEVFYDG